MAPRVATRLRLLAGTAAESVVTLRTVTVASRRRTSATSRAAGRACSPCALATVNVAVSNLGRTSVTFAHEVYDQDGNLSADGSTVIVRIDGETRRPIPWSDRFRELVRPILLP